jgi:tRNA A-37 threonylcarbamoyl transferase component Bud32
MVNILKLLHRNRIHHHDVRAEDLMVNSAGVITLINFDRAVKVDRDCCHCLDAEIMEVLQECMHAPEYMNGYDASAYM